MIVSLRVLTWLIVLSWWLWLCWSFIGETFEWWIIPLISPAFVTHRDCAPRERNIAFDSALDDQILIAIHLPFDDEGFADECPLLESIDGIRQDRL